MKQVVIYTDGACRGNPGPGGWGVVLHYQDHEKTMKGSETETTNNRMELMAAIKGIESLNQDCMIKVVTDSNYVRQGMSEWIHDWKKRDWKTKQKKPVKNVDLWQQLDAAVQSHHVTWEWVKGHSGHPQNELADQLANEAIDEMFAK